MTFFWLVCTSVVFAVCSPTDVIKESEVSVYDIHDHPDYKFRPGHSVIRVAGFEVCIFSFFLLFSLNMIF